MDKYRQSMTHNNGVMRMRTQNARSAYPRTSGGCGCSDVRMNSDYGYYDDNNGCTGLAMGVVKNQPWQNIYPCEKAITRGTIFADLDLPFTGRRGGCK